MLKWIDDVEEIEEIQSIFAEERLRKLLLATLFIRGRIFRPGREVVEDGAAEDGVGVVDV